eukprot:g19762.t1
MSTIMLRTQGKFYLHLMRAFLSSCSFHTAPLLSTHRLQRLKKTDFEFCQRLTTTDGDKKPKSVDRSRNGRVRDLELTSQQQILTFILGQKGDVEDHFIFCLKPPNLPNLVDT